MGLTQAAWDGSELVPFGNLQRWFQIGGTVRDANTLAVIPNAQLSIANTGRIAVSDDEGHFQFGLLPAGNYTLNANAAGFQAASKNITVPAAVVNAYDINLTP